MSDFNILIGVDLQNAETQIKDMITRAGASYKLNLEATMDSKNIKMKLGELEKLKANIEKFKINVDSSSLDGLDKTANKIGKTIENSMDAVGKDAKNYENSLRESEKTIGRIQKISQKTNVSNGKKTSTDKKGNDFVSKTVKYDVSAQDVKDEFNELTREITKDFKGLEKYIDKLTEETEGWKHVAGLLPEEFEELKTVMLSLNGLMQDDPMGFDSALKRVKKLQVELSRLEAMTVTKFQGLSKIEAMSKATDLSKVKPSQKKEQEESLESLRNKATQKDVGDGDYTKLLNVWIDKNRELGEQNTKNISVQKEVDKLTKNVGGNIEKWKTNGNLAKEEIEGFEKSLQSLDVLSDSFDKNLKQIGADLKTLSNQDKEIADKKLDQEKAIEKATSERVAWQKKINDLEREGYTHNGQMKALNTRLGKLDEKKITSLREVNKILQEMNVQYSKAQTYQKNTKFANVKSAKNIELNGKVDKNLDANLVGSESISKINDEIKKMHQTDTVEKFNKATAKVLSTYDDLLAKQKLVIQGKKDEGVLQEALAKMEKQTQDEITQRANENNDSKANEKMKELQDLEELQSHLGQMNQKDIDKEIDANRELHADKAKRWAEEKATEASLTKSLDKYLKKLEEVGYNTSKNLKDNKNIEAIEVRILDITTQINERKQRNVNLSYQEQQSVDRELLALNRVLTAHREAEASIRRQINQAEQLQKQFESVSYRATRGFEKNPKENKELTSDIRGIESKVQSLNANAKNLSVDEFEKEIKSISKDFDALNTKSRNFRDDIREIDNNPLNKFTKAMKSVPVWASAMGIFYASINAVQQGFQSLLDVDKAMVELGKVTDATGEQLANFESVSHDIGNSLGVLSSDVINATADFQKLGYSLEEASLLGQNSILYAKVGDMDIEESTQHIISTVKGFGIEIDKAGNNIRGLIDIMNEVGNNYSITSAGIGEALRRSSATLSEAGNSVEESVGIITAANSTIQDPERVGTALKTISLRLRGVEEDGSSITGLAPKLEKTFNSFGESILLDENTFKSTFDILDTLSQKWDTLTDMERSNLVYLIGGMEQGSIVSATINNWSDATDAYETALNSAGSAQNELNKTMDGYEFKIGRLKNAVETFWVTLADDKAFKTAIDGLTKMVELATKLVDTLGSAQVAGNLIGLGALVGSKGLRKKAGFGKKKDEDKGDAGGSSNASNVANTASILATEAVATRSARATSKAGDVALKSGAKFASSALAVGSWVFKLAKFTSVVGLVTLGLQLITKGLTFNSDAREANISRIQDEITAYESLQSKYSENEVDRYVSLNTRGEENLNTEELDEYHRIQQQITTNMPELISYFDEQGDAVLLTADQVRNLREETEKLYLSNRQEAFKLEVEDTDFSDLNDKIKQTKEAMNHQNSSAKSIEAFGFLSEAIKNDLDGLDGANEQYAEKLNKIKDTFKELIGDDAYSAELDNQFMLIERQINVGDTSGAQKMIEDNMSRLKESVKNAKSDYSKSQLELDGASKDFNNKIETAFQLAVEGKGIDINSNDWLFIQKMKEDLIGNIEKMSGSDVEDVINNVPAMIEDAFKAIEGTDINMSDLFVSGTDDESINKLRSNFDTVINSIKGTDAESLQLIRTLNLLKETQLGTASSMAENPVKPFTSFAVDVAPLVTQFTDKIADLDSAYRTLAEGQQLSTNQIMNLITQYPELTKHLEKKNGVLTLSAKALKIVAKQEEVNLKTGIKGALEEAKTAQAKTKSKLAGYVAELKGLGAIDEAKKKSAKAEAERLRAEAGALYAIGDIQTAGHLMERAYIIEDLLKEYSDYATQIKVIKDVMNSDWSSNLGKINDPSDFATPKEKKEKKEKADKEYQDSIYVVDEYTKKIDELNSSIETLKIKREGYVDFGKKYQKSIKDEIKLVKEKKKAIDAEIKSLEKQIKTGKIKETGIVDNGSTTDKKANNNSKTSTKTSTKTTKLTGSSNAQKAFNYFKSQGFSDEASAGIVGNLQQESTSKLDPKMLQIGGGGGKGIAQWDKSRWKQLETWAKKNNKEVYSLETQLEFVMQELKGASGTDKTTKSKLNKRGGLSGLKKNTNVKSSTRVFQESFERAGDIKYGKRYNYAENALNNYGGSKSTKSATNTVAKKTSSTSAKVAKSYLNDYYITDGFNARGGAHKGIDLNLKGTTGNGDKGTPVKSISGGKVLDVYKNNPTAGNAILITGDDGKTYQYNHLESAPKFNKDDRVDAGKVLGKIGNTGSGEYAHLDLKIKDENGNYIDPEKYLKQLSKGTAESLTTGITNTLKKGSTGADVKKLQKELGITQDGIYGNDTVNAVKKYQKKNDITADGIAGAKTLKKIGLQKTVKTKSKDENKTAGATEAERLEKVAQAEKKVLELNEAKLEAQSEQYELEKKLLDSKMAGYENDRTNLDDNIAYAEYAMSLYDQSSKKYKYYADLKISRLKTLQKSHKAELDFLEKELKTNKDLSDQAKQDLKDNIVQKRIEVYDANSAVQDEKNSLAEIAIDKIFEKHQREQDAYAKKIEAKRNKIKYNIDPDKPLANQLKEQEDTVKVNKDKVTTTTKDLSAEKKLLKTQEKNVKSLTATEKRIKALKKEILTADKTTKKKLQDELKQHEKVLKVQKKQAKDLASTKKKTADLEKKLKTSNNQVKKDTSVVDRIKKEIKAQEKLLKTQKTAKGKAKVQKKIDSLEGDLKVANKKLTADKKSVSSIKEKIKAQKALLKLQTDAYDPSKVKAYEKKIKSLNTDLTKEEKSKKKHTTSVKDLEADLKKYEKQKKNAKTKEAKAKIQTSIDTTKKELSKAKALVKADNAKIKSIKSQIKEQEKLLQYQTNKKQSTANIDATKKAIASLEKELVGANKNLTASEKELTETMRAKRGEIPYLKEILSLSKGSVLDLKKQIKENEALAKKYKNNHEMLEKIKEDTKALEQELEDAENAVKDLNMEIEDAYEDLADTIVDAYLDQLELMQKAEDKKYNETMKKKDKEHEKTMDNLNEEMEMLQKIYQKKIDSIDKTESTDSFNKDLGKMEEEAKKLNEEISKLSLDDSYEAKAKNTELKKQLTELETQMEERRHDRELELRKDNLADDLEKDQEALQNKIDKNQDEYDAYVETQEKIKEQRDQFWEDELNDERKQAELRKLILEGKFEEVKQLTETWSTNISGEMENIGTSITLNFTDKIAESIAQLKLLNGIKLGSLQDTLDVGATNVNGEKADISENRDSGSVETSLEKDTADNNKKEKEAQAKKEAEAKAKKEAEAKAKKEKEAKAKKEKEEKAKKEAEKSKTKRYYVVKKGDTLSEIAQKYYGKASQWEKIQKANPNVNPNSMKIGTKLLIPFKSGGFTGDWAGDSGRLAVLHKKELVLNAQQTSDILNTAKVMERIKGALPKLSNITNFQQPTTEVSNENVINNNYEVNVTVENMSGDKKSADIVAEQIMLNIKRTRGGRF